MKTQTDFYETLAELQNQHRELLNQLRELSPIEERPELLKELKRVDGKIQALRAEKLLRDINMKQERLRELALTAWNCEQPTEDITTADGSIHKTKGKKYPVLASVPYLYLTFESGCVTRITINGERFTMCRANHEYGKPTTYTRFETFEAFLAFNGIMAAPITPQQFADFSQKLAEANAKLEEAVKVYDATREALNVYLWQHIGLVDQSNTNTYKYLPKTN